MVCINMIFLCYHMVWHGMLHAMRFEETFQIFWIFRVWFNSWISLLKQDCNSFCVLFNGNIKSFDFTLSVKITKFDNLHCVDHDQLKRLLADYAITATTWSTGDLMTAGPYFICMHIYCCTNQGNRFEITIRYWYWTKKCFVSNVQRNTQTICRTDAHFKSIHIYATVI